jgi:hypothetical protein
MILCCHITNMTHLLMYLQAPSVFSSGKWLQRSEYIDGFLLLASLSIRWWQRKVSCFELWMGTTKRWRKDSHLIVINAWVRVGSAICIAYNGKWTVTLYWVIFAGAMHPYFNEKIIFSLDIENSKQPYWYQEWVGNTVSVIESLLEVKNKRPCLISRKEYKYQAKNGCKWRNIQL